jgi:hypothetical protein
MTLLAVLTDQIAGPVASPVASLVTSLALLAGGAPEPEDVKAGWTATRTPPTRPSPGRRTASRTTPDPRPTRAGRPN